jgi:hypothetical protein
LQSGSSLLPWDVISDYILSESAGEFNRIVIDKEADGTVRKVTITKIPMLVKELAKSRVGWGDGRTQSRDLLTMMNRHLGWKLTDPRDKTRGFLGISSDGQHLTQVDYSTPVAKVYLSFATVCIKTYTALRVIQAASSRPERHLDSLATPS